MDVVTFQDVVAVIALIGSAVAIIATIIKSKRSSNKDAADEARQSATVLTEIGYIKANTDEIKAEQKEQRKVNTEYATRLAAVEQSSKSLHKRVDRIDGIIGRGGGE